MRTINHESDFKIIEGFKDGSSILEAPFRFTYYTKVTRGVHIAEYNGSEFINCHPTDDGRVVVPFDSPKLGMGVLNVKREFFLSDKDFADGICNLVSIESAGIMLDRGATDMDGEVNIELFPFYQQGETGKSAYQEWLDLGNEGTTADFIASLRGAAFTYEDFTEEQLAALKGEKGDKMTYDDLTEEEKVDLAKKVIGNAEDERRAAEIVRQENEVTREEQEAKRIETFNTNESQREDAFNTAQSQMAQDFQESQTRRSNTFTANEDSRQETANASEASRKQTFETNEQERQSIFTANESERRVAETNRQGREAMRVTAENSRESAETQRRIAEIGREETFTANETQREQIFEANEDKRQTTFAANEVLRQEAEAVREANEKRREETYKSKVDKDDNAPKLTAGFANNLVGRGEATEEEISFRPSGGDTSIEDGTARIERMKGNTVVWNQLAALSSDNAYVVNEGNTYNITPNGSPSSAGSGSHSSGWCYIADIKDVMVGHSYMVLMEYERVAKRTDIDDFSPLDVIVMFGNKYANYQVDFGKKIGIANIFTVSGGNNFHVSLNDCIVSISNPQIIDLTQMFGAGNEPTTIEEFNARKPIGIDEYAYNEGELISTNVDEVKSVGFNAWDESREWGDILSSNGADANSTSVWRSDFIKVIPNEKYIVEAVGYYGFGLRTRFYTHDKTFISITDANGKNANSGSIIVIPANAGYMRIAPSDSFIPYNTPICIHLTHTGYRNGEYEPYKEFRRSIPISDIKDSEGNQLFPLGLLSAGSVYDEITATRAIKRIGVVDMGTLNWRFNNDGSRYFAPVASIKQVSSWNVANFITKLPYVITPVQTGSNTKDDVIGVYASLIYIKDTDYNDTESFVSSMQGVMLYYELAEPIEVDLTEPLNLDYEVSDFGTEEVISDVPTTPLKADIIYQFNAVDRIRDNSRHTAEAEVTLDTLQKGQLNLTVKDNGNIVLSNANGVSKEFMPATPSGDPMHYAYVAAGAKWNDTDATITKTLETVSYDHTHYETFSFEHKPKCWYLNGIGDITNEEMMRIYNIPHKQKYKGAYSSIQARTVFFDGNGSADQLDYSSMFSLSMVLGITYSTSIYSNATLRMFNCVSLKYILPSLKGSVYFYGYFGFGKSDFNPGIPLEEIRIYKLRKNGDFSNVSKLSKNSVRYMINTSDASTAIIIALHADVYAKLATDADVIADLEAKNAELQGTGGSISLVSA